MLRRCTVLAVVVAVLGLTACLPGTPKIEAHGSVGQIWVDHAAPNVPMQVVDRHGKVLTSVDLAGDTVRTRTTDANGTLTFRYVRPGRGYRVRASRLVRRAAIRSGHRHHPRSTARPGDRQLPEAQQRLRLPHHPRRHHRSRTWSRLPGPPEDGPYPTVIEYSGYDPANPDVAAAERADRQRARVRHGRRQHPRHGLLGRLVPVLRARAGTDGYDAVETVAAQPWVLNHKVGMVGISYPGISQLYAAPDPPAEPGRASPRSSVLDDGFRDPAAPGGIFNDGFALSWVEDRATRRSRPAKRWAQEAHRRRRRDRAPTTRAARPEPRPAQLIDTTPYFPTTATSATRSRRRRSSTRSTCRCSWPARGRTSRPAATSPTMLADFTGTTKKHFTLANGGHTEVAHASVICSAGTSSCSSTWPSRCPTARRCAADRAVHRPDRSLGTPTRRPRCRSRPTASPA